MARVFAYGRASTGRQQLTEAVQKEKCTSYYKAKLTEDHEWGGFFYDAATSSRVSMLERPQGRQILLNAQEGDHIIWAKLDRAFRSTIDGARTFELLTQKGIYIHSIDINIDTSTPMGKCMLHIMLALAELERDQISQRTKDALHARPDGTNWHRNHVYIGWKKLKVKGKDKSQKIRVVPCQDERNQVEAIAAMRYQYGYGLRTLAQKMRQVLRPDGRQWNKNSIKKALVARSLHPPYPKRFVEDQEPLPLADASCFPSNRTA